MHKYARPHVFILGAVVLVAVPLAMFTLPELTKTNYETGSGTVETLNNAPLNDDNRVVVNHLPTPPFVRAIYMTSCVAGTPDFRSKLVSLIETTELNSVVIDIKDYSGTVSFPVESPILRGAWENAGCGARDMQAFLEELHKKGIYVIGRITVFQDPYYANVRPDLFVRSASNGEVWHDYKGLSFVDVGAREYWDYIVELSKESYNIGFDELNFDYIRYPSDGNIKDISYTYTKGPKAEQLERFFAYLNKNLKNPELFADTRNIGGNEPAVPKLSADLFGMTTTNTDDLNVGQVLERALPYFDYVSPMVYPSHYPANFNGWDNPNKHPYDIVYFSMESAVRRAVATTTTVVTLDGELLSTTTTSSIYKKFSYNPKVFRPWIQDFDYGGEYDVKEVKAQIQATYDAGLDSWMLWSPSNRYTTGALLPAEAVSSE